MKPWTIDDIEARLNELDKADDQSPRERVRQRLMDVAGEHFARFGYRRARVGDIAHDAGVGKGTLYLYFDSKRALLIACLSREKRALLPKMRAALSLPPSQRLEAYLRASIRFTMTAPISSALLRSSGEMESLMTDQIKERPGDRDRGIALVSSLIVPISPGLPQPRVEQLAAMLMAVSLGAAHVDRSIFSLQLDGFIDDLAMVLARGIAASGAE